MLKGQFNNAHRPNSALNPTVVLRPVPFIFVAKRTPLAGFERCFTVTRQVEKWLFLWFGGTRVQGSPWSRHEYETALNILDTGSIAQANKLHTLHDWKVIANGGLSAFGGMCSGLNWSQTTITTTNSLKNASLTKPDWGRRSLKVFIFLVRSRSSFDEDECICTKWPSKKHDIHTFSKHVGLVLSLFARRHCNAVLLFYFWLLSSNRNREIPFTFLLLKALRVTSIGRRAKVNVVWLLATWHLRRQRFTRDRTRAGKGRPFWRRILNYNSDMVCKLAD